MPSRPNPCVQCTLCMSSVPLPVNAETDWTDAVLAAKRDPISRYHAYLPRDALEFSSPVIPGLLPSQSRDNGILNKVEPPDCNHYTERLSQPTLIIHLIIYRFICKLCTHHYELLGSPLFHQKSLHITSLPENSSKIQIKLRKVARKWYSYLSRWLCQLEIINWTAICACWNIKDVVWTNIIEKY